MKPWQVRVRRALQVSALGLLCLPITTSFAVYLDADRLASIEAQQARLRWFNIEGSPEWLAGVKPAPPRWRGSHVITLKPGEESLLRVDYPGQLRIHAESGRKPEASAEFSISNGSGLFRTLQAGFPAQDADLLLQPDEPSDAVYRIRHTGESGRPLRFSAYRAAFHPAAVDGADYWPVPSDLETFAIAEKGGGAASSFVHRQAGDVAEFNLLAERWEQARGFELALRMDLSDPDHADARQLVVEVSLDGRAWREFFILSSPERRRLVFVDGSPALLGRDESIHFMIPQGAAQISVRTSVPAYLRLQGKISPSYLWSGNEIAQPATGANDPASVGAGSKLPERVRLLDRDAARDSGDWVDRLFRFGRDNRYRESGLTAIAHLREASAGRADVRELNHALGRLSSELSFWRPLVPEVSSGALDSRAVRLVLPGREDADAQQARRFWTHPAQLAGELEQMLEGTLARGSTGAVLSYQLEARVQPSTLLLAIPEDQRGRVEVRFDDREPFSVDAAALPDFGRESGEITRSETTAMLGAGNNAVAPIAVDSSYAASVDERPAVAMRSVRIPLPADVKTVRLAAEPGDALPPEVALWVRTSRTSSLDEFSYRHYLASAGPQLGSIFAEALRGALNCESDASADPASCFPDAAYSLAAPAVPDVANAARHLRNDWVPLFRLLRSRLRLFSKGIPEFPGQGRRGRVASTGSISRARQHVRERRWLPALEEWSAVAASTNSGRALQGRKGQVQALRQLGEHRKAEEILGQLALHSRALDTQAWAARTLEQHYREQGKDRLLTGLRVATLLDGASSEEFEALVRALLREGFDQMAIRLQLAVGSPVSDETLLGAMFRERWMLSLEEQLKAHTPEVRAVWTQLIAIAQGSPEGSGDESMQEFRGSDWHAALQAGLSIRQRLQSDDPGTRRAATFEWRKWWADHPGTRRFVDAASRVRNSAGGAHVAVPERNLNLLNWRASSETPVTLSVAGPARLRIFVRPIYAKREDGRYPATAGFVDVQVSERQHRFAFAGNRPSSSLALLADAELLGHEMVREIDIPAGKQVVRIAPDAGAVLLRTEREQPAVPLAVLPQPDPLREAWILGHGWPERYSSTVAATLDSPFSILSGNLQARLAALIQGNTEDQAWIAHDMDWRAHMIEVSPDAWRGKQLATWSGVRETMIDAEQTGAATLVSKASGSLQADGSETARLLDRVQTLIHQGRPIDRALLAEISHAADRNPADPDIAALLRMARDRGAGWEVIRSVDQSAGIRRIPVRGWSPETPSLRIRRALMPEQIQRGEILTGGQAMTLVMRNLSPARVRVSVREFAPGTDSSPLTVSLSVDRKAVGLLRTGSRRYARRVLNVAAGDHEIRVAARHAFPGRYIHLLLEEYDEDLQRWTAIDTERTRPYLVATPGEPVSFRPTGPAWLRIDSYRNGAVSAEYRYIPKRGTRVVLGARDREDTTLYRIFEYVPRSRPARLESADPAPDRIASASQLPVEEVQLVRKPVFRDSLSLGGQEDGTYSVYGRYALRRTTDSEGIGGEERDHARELGFKYRERVGGPQQATYYESGVFLREPDSADLLLGLRMRVDRYLGNSPWALGGRASVYLQDLNDADFPAWGAVVRGSVSHHHAYSPRTRQTVTVQPFLRKLGISGSEAARTRPDPDLYTRYKRSHRHGVTVSWSGRHDLHADTRLRLRSSLLTNEDFNPLEPDRADMGLSVEQKIGQLAVGAGYRSRYFFNDGGRSSGVTRNRFTLFGDWSLWSHSGNRLDLRLEAARDMQPGLWTANVGLAWHFGGGRDYTDFRPGEIRFRKLRELELPDTWTPSTDE